MMTTTLLDEMPEDEDDPYLDEMPEGADAPRTLPGPTAHICHNTPGPDK